MIKKFRHALLEATSASDFSNTFDLDGVWWEKWKSVHGDEYEIKKNEFQNTMEVRRKDGGKLEFIFDIERNKVFTNRDLDFLNS